MGIGYSQHSQKLPMWWCWCQRQWASCMPPGPTFSLIFISLFQKSETLEEAIIFLNTQQLPDSSFPLEMLLSTLERYLLSPCTQDKQLQLHFWAQTGASPGAPWKQGEIQGWYHCCVESSTFSRLSLLCKTQESVSACKGKPQLTFREAKDREMYLLIHI